MESFDEKLEKLLSSPETMAKIASLAGELSGQNGNSEDTQRTGENAESIPDLSAVASVGGRVSDDRRMAVLKALKAQTDPEGSRTIDRAVLAIRVAKTVKTVLPEVGLV